MPSNLKHIVITTMNNKNLYRVRLGPVADSPTATALLGRVKSFGYSDAKVVRE
jgi:cell division protein FtsN